MFFGNVNSKRVFMINDFEWLLVTAEITLRTHFRERFQRFRDDEANQEYMNIDLYQDDSDSKNESTFKYLLNMRVISAILANLFWNHIKILIRQRVNYDREIFNYEEYKQRGMND
jgi:hypothetical protein